MSSSNQQLKVIIEFKGGMELLFGNETRKELDLLDCRDGCSSDCWTIKDLINLLKDNYLKERPELFMVNETIRPGVLILVNDVDWEILGENDYKLQNGDKILFISTLHGG